MIVISEELATVEIRKVIAARRVAFMKAAISIRKKTLVSPLVFQRLCNNKIPKLPVAVMSRRKIPKNLPKKYSKRGNSLDKIKTSSPFKTSKGAEATIAKRLKKSENRPTFIFSKRKALS
jgi:hypothetical protein